MSSHFDYKKKGGDEAQEGMEISMKFRNIAGQKAKDFGTRNSSYTR